jgi:hypothetical protein
MGTILYKFYTTGNTSYHSGKQLYYIRSPSCDRSMQDDAPSPSSSALNARVMASIDHICSELKLDQIIKSRCSELSRYLEPLHSGDRTHDEIPESLANAVACALVSIAHEEAWQMHRVPKHLPDRIIGKLYGLSSSAVVYNRRLISSEITKKRIDEHKNTPRTTRTLR